MKALSVALLLALLASVHRIPLTDYCFFSRSRLCVLWELQRRFLLFTGESDLLSVPPDPQVQGRETERSFENQKEKNVSKQEALNESQLLTMQDTFSSQGEDLARRKKNEERGHQLYKMSNKILKHSKSKKDKEEAYQLLTKAADMGHLKAMEKLAAALLFGYHGPQNITAAVTLYETLAEKGSHRGQTALGFMFSYGIGMEYNQAKALVYYTFGSLGGNLISQMILGYRYWVGINVPRNCEAALTNYRKVAFFIADKLEKNEEMPVEKVRLMEKSENLSSNNDFLDWDVHQFYKFLAERGDTQIQKAFYYFLKAAKAGNTHGMAFLGKMFLEGSVAVTQSNASAFKYFTMAAEKGNAVGLWGLGLLYYQGKGVPVNYTEAFKYFHIAAEKGLADAQFQLGVMYHSGSGVRRDYKLAFKYFYLASQNGQPIAVYYLAQMYAAGTGVFRSCQNAVELYRSVCELGSWSEKFLTAYFAYQDGNIDSSLIQYALLAEMGYEVAQSNSAYILESEQVKILSNDQMYPLALLLWNRAAAQGNAFARVKTGDYHFYGYGTKRDYVTAAIHYSLAVDHHIAQAMFNLAYMYEHGLGIPKDIHLANRWYDLAAQTSPDASIPVFLAHMKLEVKILFSEIQLFKTTIPAGKKSHATSWKTVCIIAYLTSYKHTFIWRHPSVQKTPFQRFIGL
ncbi:protein sel-1 homolog 2 isoform X2 [Gopherus flavomarginatus]|uniref:protein sel-1 homolog 2 isoform X2 n=1 Tax=Gopherus flavomarginatus TaxID=286002 RepID=UPI0021CC1FC3|nr:protein sel-1 homolog 2 isoform X2 [Gopherus flavomarginatus]